LPLLPLGFPGGCQLMAPKGDTGKLIYKNPLATPGDIKNFQLEGDAKITFANNRMTMENAKDTQAENGQDANFVLWCPEVFPANIEISFDFKPLREPGLCILFFAARGLLNGKMTHVLDKGLAPRQGIFKQYVDADLDLFHISYFRRRWQTERALNLVNLRRAPGHDLLMQGADPIPSISDVSSPYKIRLWRKNNHIKFYINQILILSWQQKGKEDWPSSGSIGFRQMAPLKAAYANLEVRST